MSSEDQQMKRLVRLELTGRDLEAITCYGDLVEQLSAIFDEELVALEGGHLDQLQEIFERKQKVAQSMEIKMPIIEGLIDRDDDPVVQLKAKMATMSEKAARVSIRIERIAAATSAVMREISKVQEKHSLSGMYSHDGRKRRHDSSGRQRIDESL